MFALHPQTQWMGIGTWHKHLRPALSAVRVYDVPPSQSEARLHANEASCQWPSEVLGDVFADLGRLELTRYPDTSARALRKTLAARHGCDAERIVVGNGSAEIIGLFYALLSGSDAPVLVVPVPAFAMFANSGRAYGFEVREVPLTRAFELDLSAMRVALAGATLCVIARPNNPTGSLYPSDAIGALVAEFPDTVFIIDEAYGAYAPGSSLLNASAPSNQVHLGSLSKIGLAALRIGYCVADPALALALDKMRMPYNIPETSIALAQSLLLRHADVLEQMTQAAIERREAMREILARIAGAHVHRSKANMVLVSFESRVEAAEVQAALLEHGVHVRDVSDEAGFAQLGIAGCLRVSTGTTEELELLEAAIDDAGLLAPKHPPERPPAEALPPLLRSGATLHRGEER